MKTHLKGYFTSLFMAFAVICIIPATVKAATITEREPNEYKAAATRFNIGDICSGEIGSYALWLQRDTTDIDWYVATVDRSGIYRFSFPEFFSHYYRTTLIIDICDQYGQELTSPCYYMEDTGEEFCDFTVTVPGKIYVKLYNYFDDETQSEHYYKFSINSICNINGHNSVLENAYAATYKRTGYTGDRYCSVCGQKLSTGSTIPKLTAKKQNISVSKRAAKTVTFKASSLKRKKTTFKIAAKARGKITYKVTKGSKKYISVNSKGLVTMKKRCKKGTYKITVTASATSNGQYKKAIKVITIRVK